jgi:hypothetical protein
MTTDKTVWTKRMLWACVLGSGSACMESPVDEPDVPFDGDDAAIADWDAGRDGPKLGSLPTPIHCGADDPGSSDGRDAAADDEDGGAFSSDAGVAGADASTDAGPRWPRPSRAGDLVITELMIDPKALSDTEGEWFELYNGSGLTLSLEGCRVDDGSSGSSASRTFDANLVMEPFGYATVARSESPGFLPDVVLPVSFTNTADSLAIVCDAVVIDRVAYDKSQGFAVQAGKSLALDPSRLDAAGNDVPEAWCAATTSYGVDLGTPGAANPSCAPAQMEPDAP